MRRVDGCLLLLCLTTLACVCTVETRALRHRNRNHRRPQARHDVGSNQQYYWMCPDVVCPSLPESCEQSEFIIFEYDFEGRDGRAVSVRCESCEYCLDVPTTTTNSSNSSTTSRRERRSLYGHTSHGTSGNDQECPNIVCPDLPPACSDIRLTDVVMGTRRCKLCPACYDSTVVKDL